jgi:hypothetical protein
VELGRHACIIFCLKLTLLLPRLLELFCKSWTRLGFWVLWNVTTLLVLRGHGDLDNKMYSLNLTKDEFVGIKVLDKRTLNDVTPERAKQDLLLDINKRTPRISMKQWST